MSPEELLKHARQFAFPLDKAKRHYLDVVRVEWRSDDSWVICFYDDVLNTDDLLEWEPRPSNRDEAFITRTRFTLDEAVRRAQKLVKKIEPINGSIEMQVLYKRKSP